MTDPFAGLEATSTENTDKKENLTMTQNTENQSKVVITLKGGAGYDAPWVVIHATDPSEALETMNDDSLKEVLERAKKIGTFFSGGSSTAVGANGKPAGATQAPGGNTPPEGYVYKSGVSKKNGRPWQAFMPIDRNSGLETIWLNADGSRRD